MIVKPDVVVAGPVCRRTAFALQKFLSNQRDIQECYPGTQLVLATNEADFIEDLNGMFGIALWDSKKKRLILARDRLGIKPLHYMMTREGEIVFASEIKALLKFPGWEPKLDLEALNLYLTYEYVPTPKTIYEGVLKLPPGYMLFFEKGCIRLKEYWDLDYSSGRKDSRGLRENS